MNLKEIEYYCFLKEYSNINLKKISKIKKISIIYCYNNRSNLEDLLSLEKFCNKNKIKLYISNYSRKINFLKINGIHICSQKKTQIYNLKNNLEIIGTVHNQLEYNRKKIQGCNKIFLSNLFNTKKYSANTKLGINKFNLISKHWNVKILALGGINEKNLKKIQNLKVVGFGGVSFFKKKPHLVNN